MPGLSRSTTRTEEQLTPYEMAASLYVQNGWSPIPMTLALPDHPKGVPMGGVTGGQGAIQDAEAVTTFLARPDRDRWPNISVRVFGVVGIDIDAYDSRDGAQTFAAAEAKLGTLPATYRSTARASDPISGIRFYRLPGDIDDRSVQHESKNFGTLGNNVEVIRFGHRYAKVWPTPHPNGSLYRWYDPAGDLLNSGSIPTVRDLPELPRDWVEFLTNGAPPIPTGPDSPDGIETSRGSSIRVHTREEAAAYLEPFFAAVLAAPWGVDASFNDRLNTAAFNVANFVPEVFSVEEAWEMVAALIRHHGAEPDKADYATIRSGFGSGVRSWTSRLPTDADRSDAFGHHYDMTKAQLAPSPLATQTVWAQPIPSRALDIPPVGVDPFADEPIRHPTADVVAAVVVGRALRVTRASDMQMRACDWLWEYNDEFWIPLGGLVLLGGREGVGKSTWTARLVAQVTNGKMNGEYLGQPRGVAISATEDAWEYTIIPRLVAAGADRKRIFRVDAQQDETTCGLTLPTDMAELTKLVISEQVALVVLDPLLGTVEGKLDTHKDSDVRKALEPISRLAHESRSTVLGLIHQNKAQSGDLLTRMMGSRAFSAVARAVLVCAEADPVDETGDAYDIMDGAPRGPRQFLFGQLKNNLAARVETSIRYEIEGTVPGLDPSPPHKPIRTSRIKVVGYKDRMDVEEAVRSKEAATVAKKKAKGSEQVGDDPELNLSKASQAMEFLANVMSAHPDGIRAADGARLMEEAGFTQPTYTRARSKLGLGSVQENGGWTWRYRE